MDRPLGLLHRHQLEPDSMDIRVFDTVEQLRLNADHFAVMVGSAALKLYGVDITTFSPYSNESHPKYAELKRPGDVDLRVDASTYLHLARQLELGELPFVDTVHRQTIGGDSVLTLTPKQDEFSILPVDVITSFREPYRKKSRDKAVRRHDTHFSKAYSNRSIPLPDTPGINVLNLQSLTTELQERASGSELGSTATRDNAALSNHLLRLENQLPSKE